MKTTLGFLTEEGHTRARNTAQRIRLYAVLMFLVAGAGGYAIHKYWVSAKLTPLQRVYLQQYWSSSYKSYLPNSRSRYTIMLAVVRDPKTGRELRTGVTDKYVDPVIDDEGQIQLDQRYPVFQLKPQVSAKQILWKQDIIADKNAYEWFRVNIYEGKSIPDLWRPAWLGAILIFFSGTSALTGLYMFAQRRYVEGQPIRGTRELSPKAYQNEHRKYTGYGIKIYPQESNR